MSFLTDLLGIDEKKDIEDSVKEKPKRQPGGTVKHSPAPSPKRRRVDLISFPTVTEIKNYLLAKGETNISPDEWKVLGRITKEAIHLDRVIAVIKEMMLQ